MSELYGPYIVKGRPLTHFERRLFATDPSKLALMVSCEHQLRQAAEEYLAPCRNAEVLSAEDLHIVINARAPGQ